MKRILTASVAVLMLATGAGAASAQDWRKDGRDNHARAYEQVRRDQERQEARRDVREDRREDRRDYRRWAKGQRLDTRYRDRAYYVSDWRRHGLRAPPRGYQWRKVNDQYVLAAVATGLIASVIIANR